TQAVAEAAPDGGWRISGRKHFGSGSGGTAFLLTKARAGGGGGPGWVPRAGGWRISGRKHFGSGSGVTSFMLTTARPVGEEDPDWFLLDVRDAPWDGSRGMTLVPPWGGQRSTAA